MERLCCKVGGVGHRLTSNHEAPLKHGTPVLQGSHPFIRCFIRCQRAEVLRQYFPIRNQAGPVPGPSLLAG